MQWPWQGPLGMELDQILSLELADPSHHLAPETLELLVREQTWHNPCSESPSCFLGRRSFLCPVPQASPINPPCLPFQQGFLRGQVYFHQTLLTAGRLSSYRTSYA